MLLLERSGGDVNAAVNAFFDGGAPVTGTPAAMPVAQPVSRPAMPVAQPVAQPPPGNVVQVVCPAGVRAGESLQVSTESGLLRVTVPDGIVEGAAFLVRCPPAGAGSFNAPHRGHAQQQQQQYHGYPGQAQQPQIVVQQQPQTVHVVHSSPYYGGYGYGYGYGDPFLAGSMGFLGGMLIADAMFW